jgi:hypothetical protein
VLDVIASCSQRRITTEGKVYKSLNPMLHIESTKIFPVLFPVVHNARRELRENSKIWFPIVQQNILKTKFQHFTPNLKILNYVPHFK